MSPSPAPAGRLHVACAADAGYLRHSAAMLHSLLVNAAGVELTVDYLLGDDIGSVPRGQLQAMVEGLGATIVFHRFDPASVSELPILPGRGPMTGSLWYRIWLPEVLPDVDRLLYLDIDTIVLDSVAPLAAVDLTGHHVAGVSNLWEPWNRGRPIGLGLPPEQPYFNSGVLLMNLELMRRDDSTAALLACVREQPEKIVWGDQDALNIVLGATHLPLAPRWNAMNSVMRFPFADAAEVYGEAATEEARLHPAIRHFEGPAINKPWHLLAEPADRELYRTHRRATPWPRFVPDGITARTVARRLLRRRRPAPPATLTT